VRREATNVLLVLVGGALIKITLDGTYLRYVKPGVRPWVLAAGIVLVALAVVAILRDIRAGGHAGPGPEHDDGHGHHRASRWVWLLMLPVLAIFLIAPPALGADSVLRAGGRTPPAVTQQGNAAFPPLPRGPVVPLPMSEFITRTVWDSTNSLAGRTVRLTGFVVHDGGADYVARLVITCCAADATPMKVALTGGEAAELPDNQWVEADGTLRAGSATQANGYTPTLLLAHLRTVPAPADQYEY
jgi:uncharacterized repeat protein (TIGR03943 family)